ncbi:MAG: ABC transporter permease [Caldilineales bacterium]|nr:ABC transporter permease [Caldilineales bacterium]MCW5857597.1 ABC transporter permease [Caldilineales bacterium]
MNALMRRFRPEQLRALVLILVLAAITVFFQTQVDGFVGPRTINRLQTSVAIIAVVAVAETLVIVTRNIDLSVGSIVGFAAYIVGTQLTRNNTISPFVAVLMALAVGALLGAINGAIIAYGRVPAIIVTLGTLAIYRTILVEYSNAQTVLTSKLPAWIQTLPSINLATLGDFEVRLIFAIALAVVIIFQSVLAFLPYGRRLYAIGSNPDAARIAGFPSQRIVFLAFVLCGGLAGLAGFMFLGQYGNVTVVAAQGMELQAIAAAVVGGVSTAGGAGSAFGAFLGAILIGLLEQGLRRMPQINEFWRDALLGILILAAVAIDTVIMNRLRQIWARSEMQLSGRGEQSIETEGSTHAI